MPCRIDLFDMDALGSNPDAKASLNAGDGAEPWFVRRDTWNKCGVAGLPAPNLSA